MSGASGPFLPVIALGIGIKPFRRYLYGYGFVFELNNSVLTEKNTKEDCN